jgi:hypothetical protein
MVKEESAGRQYVVNPCRLLDLLDVLCLGKAAIVNDVVA